MKKEKFDILSIGTIYLDINFIAFPLGNGLKIETHTVGDKYEFTLGGSAMLFAWLSSIVGLKSVFVGKIGKGLTSKLVKDLVMKQKVTTKLIEKEDVQTSITTNYVSPNGKTLRTTAGNANYSLNSKEVFEKFNEVKKDLKYVYLGGCAKMPKLMSSYFRIAKECEKLGVKIILDHGKIHNKVTKKNKDNLKKIISMADVYLPSRGEFLDLWGFKTIKDGLNKLHNKFPSMKIVVKNSARGAIGVDQSGRIEDMSPRKVKVINTIGAGDSFNVGFIMAQIKKKNFHDSIKYGISAATAKISKVGMPTKKEIYKIYKNI